MGVSPAPLGRHQGAWWRSRLAKASSVLWEPPDHVCSSAAAVLRPASSERKFPWLLVLGLRGRSSRRAAGSHRRRGDCTSLVPGRCGKSFHAITSHLQGFGEVSVKVLGPVLTGVFVLLLWIAKSLLCLGGNSLSWYVAFANIFCQSVALFVT